MLSPLIIGFWSEKKACYFFCYPLLLSFFSAGPHLEKGGRNDAAALMDISMVTTGFVPIGRMEIILVFGSYSRNNLKTHTPAV